MICSSNQFNQISLTSTIIIGNFQSYRYLAILSNLKSGAEINISIFIVNLEVDYFYGTGRYFADVSKMSLRLEGEETLKYRCVCRPPCGKV